MSAASIGRALAPKVMPGHVGLMTLRGRSGRPRRARIITTDPWADARIVEKLWNMPAPERGSRVENESAHY